MDKKTRKLERRLKITENEISFVEELIADTKKRKSKIPPKTYDAKINGYNSIRNNLESDAANYRAQLRLS